MKDAAMNPPTPADQKANETPQSPLPRPTGRNANAGGGADADVEAYAVPDADADRDAPASSSAINPDAPKTNRPPLGIKQIEDLEDDAMGG
jgi:hypothetical protein